MLAPVIEFVQQHCGFCRALKIFRAMTMPKINFFVFSRTTIRIKSAEAIDRTLNLPERK
jgi:hypothetical protein